MRVHRSFKMGILKCRAFRKKRYLIVPQRAIVGVARILKSTFRIKGDPLRAKRGDRKTR